VNGTRSKRFGFLAQAFGFFGETFFKGAGLLQTASLLLHSAAPGLMMGSSYHKLPGEDVLF
jgi:hypothetical protein